MRYCSLCKSFKKVASFDRDNPVLTCGHVIIPSDRIYECRESIESRLRVIAPLIGVSVDTLRDSLFENVLQTREDLPYMPESKS
jgi:hypothetical protein